jgi:guanine nucleotide-binding protein G(I)/G(S)/G(T) subunit beta-1
MQITTLTEQIEKAQTTNRDKSLSSSAKTKPLASIRNPPSTKARRVLKGHFGKVTALHWSGDSESIVSASQDGNLIVWNALTGSKTQALKLKSQYVMAVGMEQSKGNLMGSGGLDNICTIYNRTYPTSPVEMSSHDGFISCLRFVNEASVLTSSGDASCIHWDVAHTKPISRFNGHTADVMFLSIRDPQTFASCSVDKTIKLWDVRAPKVATQTLVGHLADVNGIEFLPVCDSHCLASCSQDGTVRIWDLRIQNELARIGNPVAPNPASMENDGYTSLGVSASGRLVFCGHSDGSVYAFDVLSDKNGPAFTLNGAHERHVSCVGVSPDGNGLCTGSWDSVLKIWA